jgi:nicotinate-nucleotide adenylyltransferase
MPEPRNPTSASGESEGMSLGAAGLRVGIMGGTFDPIHYAHLLEAREVAHRFALDEVMFVPAGQPWQKDGRAVSPAEDRYAMTVLATKSNHAFSVSRVEVDRPGPTYTVDTLRELRRAFGPKVDLFFILGADALAQIFTWRDASKLFTFAHFVGCSRVGYQLADPGIPGGSVSLVEVSGLPMSSSLIRCRVRAGQPISHLVPDAVAQYISQHGLYRDG